MLKKFDDQLRKQFGDHIIGCDEVGRGPLAGPVVATCILLPKDFYHEEIQDSKKISKTKMEFLFKLIKENCIEEITTFIDVETIDKINILEATKLAMKTSVEKFSHSIDLVLTDHVAIDIKEKQMNITKGDSTSFSIAAASIIAKFQRDLYMKELSLKYPEYGFDTNAGYGTKKHLKAIEEKGIIKEHRKTFAPIKNLI